MKNLFAKILVLIAIGGFAIYTCPKKEDHKTAVMEVVKEKMNDDLGSAIGSIGSRIGEWYVDNNLTVEDNYVFSTGYLNYDGEKRRVSIGVFGHVFPMKEELEQILNNN